MKLPRSGSLWLTALALLAPVPVFAQDVIGTVITTKGTVLARDAAGMTRALTRRKQIYERDTLIVCADGFTSVRLVDNAQISFRADSEFSFDVYEYDGDPATPDNAVMTLRKGGFRSVSGSIGAWTHDTYRVDTPQGSIGIRGTYYGAVLEEDVLYTGAYSGGITVSNALGSLNLGMGGDADFSRTLPGQAAEVWLDEPSVLKAGFGTSSPSPAPSTPASCPPGP